MPTLQEISSSMCDVRKSVGRLLILALSAGLLAVAVRSAQAQITSSVDINKRKQEAHARRETNASRQARIARTVEDTYSHRYEVMGGGGFLRFRSGSRLKRNNEISWNTAFNYYFNPKLSVIGDAQGSFGHAKALTNNTYGVPSPQINEYFFMGGVSYRFYRKERVAISAQALGGIGWGIFSGGSKAIPAVDLGLWQDGTRPSVQLGVSADYNFYPNIAFRFTPTWTGTTFQSGAGAPASSLQGDFGFNAGIIYRFGRQ
jgi:hypothetical protein